MLWLRHVTIITDDLEGAEREFSDALGLQLAYRDPNVGSSLSIVNGMLPVGDDFVETVAPLGAETAGARYLERRKGPGGYLVVISTDDLPAIRARVEVLGMRIVHSPSYPDYAGIHLHPKDTAGSLVEFNWQSDWDSPERPYHPAGPRWRSAVNTEVVDAIAAVEIQGSDPTAAAATWSRLVDRPVERRGGQAIIRLDRGELRFAPDEDGRGPGFGGLDLHLTRGPLGQPQSPRYRPGDQLMLSGMRVRLV